METNLNELYNAALPLGERAELAAALYESVVASQEADRSDPWVEELRRRIEKLESGDAELLTWEEVEQRLAERHAEAQLRVVAEAYADISDAHDGFAAQSERAAADFLIEL